MWFFFGLLAAQASDPGLQVCPPGMVLVNGQGNIGMKGQPYGVVPTAHLKKVVAPEKGCEEAIQNTEGASVCWVQTDLVDPVLPPRTVKVVPFCIEAYPFPGEGRGYTKDGLNAWTAKKLDDVLRAGNFGRRRLCTATEFQLAVAGPKTNLRFVYGDQYDANRCSGDRIGADPACSNPETRVHEYGAVHSHWVVADADFVRFACESTGCIAAGNRKLREGMYVVMGGTSRFQTRQAPLTPHTWHDHGDATPDACSFVGWDDQVAICADPGSEGADVTASWAGFQRQAASAQSMSDALSALTGESVCGVQGR